MVLLPPLLLLLPPLLLAAGDQLELPKPMGGPGGTSQKLFDELTKHLESVVRAFV